MSLLAARNLQQRFPEAGSSRYPLGSCEEGRALVDYFLASHVPGQLGDTHHAPHLLYAVVFILDFTRQEGFTRR